VKLVRRWRALRHRRIQSALAIAAIATAVVLPVVLLSVGGGVAQHEIHALEHSGYQVTVSAPGLHGVQAAHPLASRIDAIPNVASASPVLSAALDSFPGRGGSSPVLAEGVIPAAFSATEGPEELGLFPRPLPFSDPGDLRFFANGTYQGPPVLEAMVSSPFADAYGVKVGDLLTLAPSANATLGQRFTVVGLFGTPASALGPIAAFAVLLPLSELQQMTGVGAGTPGSSIDGADTIQVALAGAASTDAGAIRSVAQSIAQIVPYYGVGALTDQAAQLRASAAVLTGFYLALSSVGLVVGLVFLALVLLRRVESERRVIGVQRALGVPRRQIAAAWLRSSAVLGGSGALGGVVGGIVLVAALARWGQGAVAVAAGLAVFDPITLGELVLGVLALGSLTSLLATRAALRLPIAEALR